MSHISDLELLSSGERLQTEHLSKVPELAWVQELSLYDGESIVLGIRQHMSSRGGGNVAVADARSLSLRDGGQRGAGLCSERTRTEAPTRKEMSCVHTTSTLTCQNGPARLHDAQRAAAKQTYSATHLH